LSDPAVHLPLDQEGIQDPPAIIDGDVAEQPRLAGPGVDLDDGDVRPERIGRGLDLEVVFDVQRIVRARHPAGAVGHSPNEVEP
jgi:hypothetical protein